MNDTARSTPTVWIVGVVVALVAIAGIVAVAVTSGSEEPAAGIAEYQDVTIVGDALPELQDAGDDPAVGTVAPVIEGKGFTGNAVTTAPGTPTLLVFLAHWCPHCQREVPVLVDWYASGAVPSGLDVIAVATSSDPASPNFPPSEWFAREGWPALWPVIADSGERTAADAFGLSGFPFFTLLDADGKVLLRRSGEIPKDELTSVVTAALGD
jgi:thiol-disulfide isomerase/thioredoxin